MLRLLVLLMVAPLWATDFEGLVKSAEGEPVRDARVQLIEAKQQTRTDREGRFAFEGVAPGTYTLQVTSDFYGSLLRKVTLDQNKMSTEIVFDVLVHEDFTVTATAERRSISDVSQAVSALSEQDLMTKMAPTLGETLASEPGVSSTYFGPGASRPIIRGMGGERIRVLEGGLETGDASVVSVDHAITSEPLTTERVEILRGPASLRYGSSAIGGVVNVIDNRIPEFLSSEPLTGTVELRGDTAADEKAGVVVLDGSSGRFAWHADYAFRDTEDVEIPGFAEIEGLEDEDEDHHEEEEGHEEEEVEGILENSFVETRKGTLGFSYIGTRGYFGASYSQSTNDYGVPGHGHHEEGHDEDGHDEDGHDEEGEEHEEEGHGEEEEEIVTIDMEQKRFDLRGGLDLDGFVNRADLRIASTDYEHFELEGDEIGTQFFNEYEEARLELTHGEWGGVTSGSFGVQYSNRDFEAFGEEAFVRPNETQRLGVYFFEEMDRDSWSLSFGARYDRQEVEGTVAEHHHEEEEDEHHEEEEGHEDEHEDEHGEEDEIESFDLSYDGFSASVGVILGKENPYQFAANLTRTERAPNAEELFSNGPHLATRAFEVGDPTLDTETSTGFDIQLRRTEGRVTGELSFYVNQFDDYIYEQATGEEEDGLTEFQFLQEDAEFRGGELHIDADLIHTDPHHLHLELTYDFVRAELDRGGDLPRIPPQRLSMALAYRQPQWWVRAEARYVDEQDRIAAFETPTDDHTLLNFWAGYRFFVGGSIHQVLLRGTNLNDEEARVHSSFLKDLAPLPGRNFSLAYRLSF